MADQKNPTTLAKWARWKWSHGIGRWHRLFTDGDLTKAACGSKRKSDRHVAEQTASKPTDGAICPVCEALDMLLDAVMTGKLTDAVSDKPLTVPAIPEPVLVPAGICICGSAGCDKGEAVELRKAHEARKAAIAEARRVEFALYLAEQEKAAAK